MTRRLRCANGHEWEAGPGPTGATPTACPVCQSENTADFPQLLTPPATSPGDSEPWPTLEGYDLLGELGRGGMGIVYLARQRDRDRLVALKVIRKDRLTHTEAVRRFRREAQAAARLTHPNVVAVFDHDQDGDVHYLAMEYVPGMTLQQLVEERGPVEVAVACDVVRQVALGLQHATDQSLVHRDIKPANVMVLASPGGPLPPRPHAKILDMGVARLYEIAGLPQESLTTLTRDGSLVGTPDYVAPEQLENPHAADIRADLYSLGCTFYFLLSGRVPFEGGTLIQKLDRQRWETPPSVDQLRSGIPAGVAAVVRRLMAKNPGDRYGAPGDLAAALTHLGRTGELPIGHAPAPVRQVRVIATRSPLVAADCSADGHTVVTAGADRVARVWDAMTGTERQPLATSSLPLTCLAVSTAGVAYVGQGASVRAYEIATGREVQRLVGHTDAVRAIALSADGQLAVTGGDDRTVRVWDLVTGTESRRVVAHRAAVTGVALTADGRLLLTGGRDHGLHMWDVGTGRAARSFAPPRCPVLAVAFSPDGRTLLSAHFDTTLRLWDVESGRELRRFSGHTQMVGCGLFTPDGRRVVSGGNEGLVRVWDPESGAEESSGKGHAGPVAALRMMPDGRHLLSAGTDATLRIWELPE